MMGPRRVCDRSQEASQTHHGSAYQACGPSCASSVRFSHPQLLSNSWLPVKWRCDSLLLASTPTWPKMARFGLSPLVHRFLIFPIGASVPTYIQHLAWLELQWFAFGIP